MKKSVVILLHLGFWSCYFILIMVMLGMYFRGEEDMEAPIEAAFEILFCFAIVPSVITFYTYYYFLFPDFLKYKSIFRSLMYGAFIALGAALTGAAGLSTIVAEDDCGDETILTFIQMTLFMAFIAAIAGVVALVIRGCLTWLAEIKWKEELQQKNHEMEMALVKAQLDPHFLFNTINNIDVLILKDAEDASNYLNKLSDIMRFMLYETKTEQILLTKELAYIEKYIELQKLRTANKNYVNYTVIGTPSNQVIAPMVFIPFIENAFKHTTNKKLDNAITITIHIQETEILFDCINKTTPHRVAQSESNGLGNELIQKRLNLLYPDQHSINIKNQNDLYQVNVSIDISAKEEERTTIGKQQATASNLRTELVQS